MGETGMNCNMRHDLMNFNGNCPNQTLTQLRLARCRQDESFRKTLWYLMHTHFMKTSLDKLNKSVIENIFSRNIYHI